MPMKEFDVVVGMDWLAEHRTSIICNKKMIKVILPERGTVVIYGDRHNHHTSLLTMLKAQKCIRKKCQGCLAYVIDTKKEKGK